MMLDLYAQTQDFQEEVHLSLNTTNILVGETLHFSVFVYSNKTKQLSELSSLLYVELIDQKGNPVHQTKVGLRGGRGAGKIYINPAWLTNTYRVVAYTKWMRNYDAYFEQSLLVLNPYIGLTKIYEISGTPVQVKANDPRNETYGQLQQVTMNLGDVEPSSLSITVSKKPNLFYTNEINLERPKAAIESYNILPDYKYAQVQGRIKAIAGDQAGERINMTVKGDFFQVATTVTDEYGRFWMNYKPELTSNGSIQIQTENESIEFDLIDEFRIGYPVLNQGKTVLDAVFMSTLIDRSIYAQIQNAYLLPEQSEQSVRNTYLNREDVIVYHLDDYKRFTSIRDTFIELTILIGVSKSEESDKIFVRCEQLPGMASNANSPMILLDGLRVDARTLLDQNPNDIEKIEVLPAYYFVDDQVYKGVISAHTFDESGKNMPGLGEIFSLSEYQPYFNQEYEINATVNLPHYERNVLWKPMHRHGGGSFVLEFTTSRLVGNYQVSIRGITNTGEPVNIARYFQVAASNQ
ncbi:MAG: hypothetical protein R8G66_19430 [Cytophagales bacterium]|nr:hypothetical protein [Cytophagales bacterium]